MPNLVGIGLSQVPTNSMLGGMAYQDPDRVKIKKLNVDEISQINSEIADTAVDIFIYDTSKDSDGGAWRKRTTHTSWYNETLGTATRGTRREFPAVAVLVLSANKLTIYDGDDPDLSMWMDAYQFVNGGSGGNTTNWHGGSGTFSSVAALNGIIVCGATGGCRNLHFVNDRMSLFYTPASGNYTQLGGISNRNNQYSSWGATDNYYAQLVAAATNDVAMTVLPNAPIDDATGLPVPTIAVATQGGVSIIKDNGTVADITGTSQGSDMPVDMISFVGNDKIMYSHRYASEINTISSSDITAQYYNQTSTWLGRISNSISHDSDTDVSALSSDNNIESIALTETFAASKSVSGLSLANNYAIRDDRDRASCFITTDYNTGWMNGDIKGAFLSDTDATNLASNDILGGKGTFDDASYWTAGATWSVSGGVATSSSSGTNYLSKNGILTTGARYTITLTVSSYSAGTLYVYCGTGAPGTANHYRDISANGTYTFVLDAYNNNFGLYGANFGGVVDNLTISSVVHNDRSVNSKDLGVIGTITKQPVATGAELVAYSFGSNSNYLEQPYNSDLDYGTGDMYYSMWIYASSSDSFGGNTYIFERTSIGDSNNRRIEARMTTPTRLEVYANGTTLDNNVTVQANAWYKLDILRRGGEAFVYINGEYRSSTTGGAATGSLTDTNARLIIGNRGYFSPLASAWPSNSKIALFRTGASAPSAAQVKKMYEDEKKLFQENAKCTLYGSSDTVTALAYDEVTERLHVGTSSGRSDFQGLRRINNTTTAVTTAISAHDGFIVEQ